MNIATIPMIRYPGLGEYFFFLDKRITISRRCIVNRLRVCFRTARNEKSRQIDYPLVIQPTPPRL